MRGRVYFLRPVGKDGPVKIGWSSQPRDRLNIYTKWSPVILEIAAEIDAPREAELRFHAQFSAQHMHHEWFAASAELTQAINLIRQGSYTLDRLPHGERLWKSGPRRKTSEQRQSGQYRQLLDGARDRGFVPPADVEAAWRRYRFGAHGDGQYDPQAAVIIDKWLAETPKAAGAEYRRSAA